MSNSILKSPDWQRTWPTKWAPTSALQVTPNASRGACARDEARVEPGHLIELRFQVQDLRKVSFDVHGDEILLEPRAVFRQPLFPRTTILLWNISTPF